MLKGLILTLRVLSPYITFREILRRIFGLKYAVNGLMIENDAEFYTVRCLKLKNIHIEKE